MRYIRILFVCFEDVFVNRGVALVWFFISFLNPLTLVLFWVGARDHISSLSATWQFPSIISYYLLLIVAAALLESHIEETVAYWDIQEGGLTKYLVKPVSYIFLRFLGEVPWRIIQGIFGIASIVVFKAMFGPRIIQLSTDLHILLPAFFICIFAYFISFFYKMILGMTAFWTTDYHGFSEVSGVLMLIFAGFLMPLTFFPPWLEKIAVNLPFAYMIYFPILALQGKLAAPELFRVLGVQCLWLVAFIGIARVCWRFGSRSYTAIGQ